MPKRVRDENCVDNIGGQHPPVKTAKPSSTCRYCRKVFTTRGFPNHVNKCKAKPRRFKFCILNETLFEHILSFLTNQTLTKLQVITGEKYAICEPKLAAYCCKCENDNLVIFHGLCRECESGLESYSTHITLTDAGEKYGEWALYNIPWEVRTTDGHVDTWYDRVRLEEHMIDSHGSKLKWVKNFVRVNTRMKKLRATLKRKKVELDAFFETLAPGFPYFLKAANFRKTDKTILGQCNERFAALTNALKERGVEGWWDSRVCRDFVITGDGDIDDVVGIVEAEELEYRSRFT
ncbi:hypothetical protein PHYPSEUDO_012351 [Phytophthora pseudosyringae]|uniref:Uncharacterized protein n=1 Tax=Phytophthora pseudosyringae TaxID=221518 RepID=A0A8T1V7P9_9STRA|nr:hypothetical protein PHYPSEUDO_012351 [Phytophthora pseudosyringae]